MRVNHHCKLCNDVKNVSFRMFLWDVFEGYKPSKRRDLTLLAAELLFPQQEDYEWMRRERMMMKFSTSGFEPVSSFFKIHELRQTKRTTKKS